MTLLTREPRFNSVEAAYSFMKERLGAILPDSEIKYKAGLVYEIEQLKCKRGAVILGHNYMEPALFQTIPDYVGDSLELSRIAAKLENEIIIFCGVRFMAETAKILNPTKKVLLPAEVAGCSLASSITADDVKKLKQQYPDVPTIAYVNTYADLKAEIDICCTSGNAKKVVESFNDKAVIFLPDQYLARNVAAETGRKFLLAGEEIPNDDQKYLIGWQGLCEVHEQFTVEDINNARKQYPDVVVLSHPECSPEVVKASDYSASTSKMVAYAKETKAKRLLVLTECSMGDNIAAENPDKELLRMCAIRCPHMHEITLEDTLKALKEDYQEIIVPEEIRVRAKVSLERMIAIG